MANPSIATYRKTKALVKKALQAANFTNIKMSNGHYYFSGFATRNDRVIYFSISDTRMNIRNGDLLIRTAESYTDYSGGTNNYCEPTQEAITKLANRLTDDMFIQI